MKLCGGEKGEEVGKVKGDKVGRSPPHWAHLLTRPSSLKPTTRPVPPLLFWTLKLHELYTKLKGRGGGGQRDSRRLGEGT